MHDFENGSYAIVHHFSGQQLHKNAYLCNCWPYFEQTIAYGVLCTSSKMDHVLRRQVKRPLQLVNLPQANYCSYVAKVFKSWRSKQELNPHLRYRKPPFYPLDYWSFLTSRIIPYRLPCCQQESGCHQGS